MNQTMMNQTMMNDVTHAQTLVVGRSPVITRESRNGDLTMTDTMTDSTPATGSQVGISDLQPLADLLLTVDFEASKQDARESTSVRSADKANLYDKLDEVEAMLHGAGRTTMLDCIVSEVLTPATLGKNREYPVPKAINVAFPLTKGNAASMQQWIRTRLAGKVLDSKGNDLSETLAVRNPENAEGKVVREQFIVHLANRRAPRKSSSITLGTVETPTAAAPSVESLGTVPTASPAATAA